MNFKEYAKDNLISVFAKKQFAKQLGLREDIVTINNYIAGRRFPKKEIIEKIYKITKKKVKPQDWFNE